MRRMEYKANLKKCWDFAFSAVFFIFFWFAPTPSLHLACHYGFAPYRDNISSVRIVPLSTRLVSFSVLLGLFPPPPPSPMRLASLRRQRRGRVLNDRPLRRLRVQPEKNQVQIKNKKRKEKKRKSGSSNPKIWDRQAKTMGGTKSEARAVRSLPSSSGCLITINHATCALRRII